MGNEMNCYVEIFDNYIYLSFGERNCPSCFSIRMGPETWQKFKDFINSVNFPAQLEVLEEEVSKKFPFPYKTGKCLLTNESIPYIIRNGRGICYWKEDGGISNFGNTCSDFEEDLK